MEDIHEIIRKRLERSSVLWTVITEMLSNYDIFYDKNLVILKLCLENLIYIVERIGDSRNNGHYTIT
jgi:hypothetical protein